MTASIPGENDTKRHRIALAALPFFLSACHLMPASKSGGVPSDRAPVVYRGRRRPRIILVHARRAAHTREMHGSSDSTYSTKFARLRWFIRPIRSRFSNFSFSPFSPGGIETSSPRGVD